MKSFEDEFIARVKKNSKDEFKYRKKISMVPVGAKLLKGFGFVFAIVGAIVGFIFFVTMETVHADLGSLVNSNLAASLDSTPEMEALFESIGITWFPTFVKVYEIRFLILLGILGLAACLSFACFAFARNLRNKNEN